MRGGSDPVTMARRPVRSMPSTTSAAVDSAPNGVVMGVLTVMMSLGLAGMMETEEPPLLSLRVSGASSV